MLLSPFGRAGSQLMLFALILFGVDCGFVSVGSAQPAATDWTPFSDSSVPELRPSVLPPYFPPRKPDDPPWLIQSSAEIDGTFTDNALGTSTDRKPDFYTTISPDLFISGQTPRILGVLNLNPQLIYYAKNSSQNETFVNLLSNGTAIVIPERLFFDEQMSISQQDGTGLQGFGSQIQVPANNRVQQYTYSVSPHAYIPISRDTDAELRYRFSQILFNQNGNSGPILSPLTGAPLAPITNSTEQEAFFKVKTSALTERVFVSATADYSNFAAPGTDFSSQNVIGALGASYLVERALWATASAGYEDLVFPQIRQLNYLGPTWEVGGRYAPSKSRLAALSFGSYEGRLGFKGNLNYALTPAVSVYARYDQQIETPQQEVFQDLPLVTQTGPGTVVDETTGLPLNLTNPNFALQNGVFYAKSLTGGAKAVFGRNTAAITFDFEDDKELAGPTPSQTSVGGFLSLTRELSPVSNASIVAGYSLVSTAAFGGVPSADGRIATVGLNFNYNLSATLRASANYSFQLNTGGVVSSVLIDMVTVGIRKTF